MRWKGEQSAQGFVPPATSMGDCSLTLLGQLREPTENMLHRCPLQGARSRGTYSPSPTGDCLRAIPEGLEQLLEENASGRDLQVSGSGDNAP